MLTVAFPALLLDLVSVLVPAVLQLLALLLTAATGLATAAACGVTFDAVVSKAVPAPVSGILHVDDISGGTGGGAGDNTSAVARGSVDVRKARFRSVAQSSMYFSLVLTKLQPLTSHTTGT